MSKTKQKTPELGKSLSITTRVRKYLGKPDDKLIDLKGFINESEEIKVLFRYDAIFRRTKIVGQTDKRSFGYRRIFNRQNFVSSNRSISHVEFGKWRIPIWMWVLLSLTVIIPIVAMFNPELATFAQGAIIVPIIVIVFSLIFRRVTYLGTAIGSQFFHIITRKDDMLPDAVSFLKNLHLNEPFNKPRTERYVIPNYFQRWIRLFIVIVVILTLISWSIVLLNLFPMETLW